MLARIESKQAFHFHEADFWPLRQAVRPSHSSRPFCGMIVRRDLKGKGLAVLERRAAVETETGDAEDGELHR